MPRGRSPTFTDLITSPLATSTISTLSASSLLTYSQRPAGLKTACSGFFPRIFSRCTTLSVAVSITDTEAEPSLDTYANGAASAPSDVVAETTVAQIMNRDKRTTGCSPSSYAARRNGAGADDRLCYTSCGNSSAPRSWQNFHCAAHVRFAPERSS